MAQIKLTESSVKALALPTEGQQFYYDTNSRGFGVRLSRETKSFFAERRLNGKTKRITIGPYPLLSVARARTMAQVILSELVQGIDRKAAEEDDKLKAITLGEAFAEFKLIKKAGLTDRTLQDYDSLMNQKLPDWMKRPWASITNIMVLKRHAEIGKTVGGPTANHLFRAFGSVFRFSMKRFKDASGNMLVTECPTAILSDTGAWFPEKARDRYIKPNELKAWWEAIQALNNETARDLLILLILTGFRLSEGLTLQWSQVDLEDKTLTLEITKNGKKHVLPIPEYLHKMLSRRKESKSSDFVFPGDGERGHMVEIRKNVSKVVAASKITFTPHDLRRTFSNCVESADISYYAHKKLMNHSVGSDVTGTHYLSLNVERLREPMEKVNRYILKYAGALPTADVVQLPLVQTQAAA